MSDTKANDSSLYSTRSVVIRPQDEFFNYCDTVTALANNLENATLFRIRQVYFAVNKEESELSENEKFVLEEIRNALPAMGPKFKMPTKSTSFLGSDFLDKLFIATNNPDRYAEGLSAQTAQGAIKSVVRNMKSYFAALKDWKISNGKYTGRPELPKYHRKGGHATVTFTNQDARLNDVNGFWFMKFPDRTTKELWLPFGKAAPNVRLKSVTVKPENGVYIVTAVLQSKDPKPALNEKPERIASVDTGVENLMAVTNNCGLQSILYKGNICKSVNQWYNKRIAKIMSEQALKTKKDFVPTEEYYRVTRSRNNRIKDILLKTAKHFVQWCVENRIDTVVIGCNKGQKQDIAIGAVNTQNFVQIPFGQLRNNIRYMCERVGIRYVEQEESYTSKASFVDGDYIPVYGSKDKETSFSGKRCPTHYKGMYRKGGFRGLYQTKDGTIINSDLNGSANILRKAFPDAFPNGTLPDFGRPAIIRYTDMIVDAINRVVQLSKEHVVSKAKLRRSKKRLSKCSPTGIELCG